MDKKEELKKRKLELSEVEIKEIRNLILEKIESMEIEKDYLDDPEYGVLGFQNLFKCI